MASCLEIALSLKLLAAICFWSLPIPGNIDITPPKPPIFFNWPICFSMSFISKLPWDILFIIWAASSSAIVSAAFSTKETTSPISNILPAALSGWKGSKPSNFSETPTNFIGQPVTDLIDKAAPPLASPSVRVKTTPEILINSEKALAVCTASWPVIASAINNVSEGLDSLKTSWASDIIAVSIVVLPAVSSIKTSIAWTLEAAIALLVIFSGLSPSISGNTETSACSPKILSCSLAAGL